MKRLKKSLSKQKLDEVEVPHHPILLVPGLMSSSLRVIESPYPSWVNKRVWLSVRSIGLGKVFANTEAKELGQVTRKWIQHMVLEEDGLSDPPGVRVRPVVGLEGVKYLDPGLVSSELSYVFGPLVSHLQDIGYSRHNLAAASYDWRLPPDHLEKRDGLFTRMKAQIENMHRNCGQKTVVVAHSLGTRLVQYFLAWVAAEERGGLEWAKTHLQTFVACGPVWLGSPKAFRSVLSGELDELSAFLYVHEGLALTRSSGVMPWMFPAVAEDNEDTLIQILQDDGSYKGISMYDALEEGRLHSVAKVYKKYYLENSLFDAKKAPIVPRLVAVYGVNVKTERQYFYKRCDDPTHEHKAPAPSTLAGRAGVVALDLDTDAQERASLPKGLEMENGIVFETPHTPQPFIDGVERCGDGTVPYESMAFCRTWQGLEGIDVTVRELEGVDHRGILKDEGFLKTVTDEACRTVKQQPASIPARAASAAIAASLRASEPDLAQQVAALERDERDARLASSTGQGGIAGQAWAPLEAVPVREFEKLWDDKDTGCMPYRGSVFRPIPPRGFFVLGDYMERSHRSKPGGPAAKAVIAVREREVAADSLRLLLPAVDFARVWSNARHPKTGPVALWRPIPPPEYVSLGFVATAGFEKPNPLGMAFRCVHLSLVVEGRVAQLLNEYMGTKATRRMLWRARERMSGFRASVWYVRPHNLATPEDEALVGGHTPLPPGYKRAPPAVTKAESSASFGSDCGDELEAPEDLETMDFDFAEDGSLLMEVPGVSEDMVTLGEDETSEQEPGAVVAKEEEREEALEVVALDEPSSPRNGANQDSKGGKKVEKKRKRDVLKRHRMRRLRKKLWKQKTAYEDINRMAVEDSAAAARAEKRSSKSTASDASDREAKSSRDSFASEVEDEFGDSWTVVEPDSLTVPERSGAFSSDEDWSTEDESDDDGLAANDGWEMIEATAESEAVAEFNLLMSEQEPAAGESGFGEGTFTACFAACAGYHPPTHPQFCLSATAFIQVGATEERRIRNTFCEGYLHVRSRATLSSGLDWRRKAFLLELSAPEYLLAFESRTATEPEESIDLARFSHCSSAPKSALSAPPPSYLSFAVCAPPLVLSTHRHRKHSAGKFPFVLHAFSGENLLLSAPTAETRDKWITSLSLVLEAMQTPGQQ